MVLKACLFALSMAWQIAQAQQAFPFGAWADGRPVTQLGAPGTRAVVLFFVASDCPISNRTFPEMRRLSRLYRGQKVRFWFVYPNATEKVGEIVAHQASFDPGSTDSAITDPDSSLVKLAHAVVTPEAAVLVPASEGWKPVYIGRVDDRFVRIGLERPAPTRFLAERALTETLSGRTATPDSEVPVGCSIVPKGMIGR